MFFFDNSHPNRCELICISLMITNVGHLFTCLVAICMSSLEKMSIQILGPFWGGLFDFLPLSSISSLFWLLTPY